MIWPRRTVIPPVFLSLFIVASSIVRAQNPNGALRGEVQDSTAARVVGAHVSLRPQGLP